MVRGALDQRWPAVDRQKGMLRDAVWDLVEADRASGEFKNDMPIEDVVDAIWISLVPFAHPFVLEHLHLDYDLARHARDMAELALSGLAR